MIEKNNIESVWVIENNQLIKANKVVSKIMYKDTEIPVLKTDMNCYSQDYLFKDSNNEYWSMGIIGFDFKKFSSISVDDTLKDTKEYCDKVFNVISKFDLKNYFSEKISKQKYFNLCELKYISKYFPDIYDNAIDSRRMAKEKYNNRINEINKQVEKERIEKVERVNGNFEKRLEEVKTYIRIGKNVEAEDFEFYKDNKYENGITTQNCFLYLAKQYGINIPLATQGFINNRLVSYDFTTGSYSFKITANKKPSAKIGEIFTELQKKVKEDFDISVKELKVKIDKMRGGK